MGYARLQSEPFRVDEVLRELRQPEVGGVTLYVGTVRGREGAAQVEALEYEAFPEMAQESLERLRQETISRFALVDAIVIHRTGRLPAGEPILVVALAGRHRAETFRAVEHFMDRLKEIVPIWKKEDGSRGPTWVVGAENRRVAP